MLNGECIPLRRSFQLRKLNGTNIPRVCVPDEKSVKLRLRHVCELQKVRTLIQVFCGFEKEEVKVGYFHNPDLLVKFSNIPRLNAILFTVSTYVLSERR